MAQQFNLSIHKPCPEKFEGFQPTQAGGFCRSCQKEVTDFSVMSEAEILQYFKDKPQRVCGRLRETQLKTYTWPTTPKTTRTFNFLGSGLMGISLLSLWPTSQSQAQEQRERAIKIVVQQTPDHQKTMDKREFVKDLMVQGIVLDEEKSPLPGVSVVIKGTTTGTVTDINGKFKFEQLLKTGDVLVFSYIGYDTRQYKIENSTSPSLDIAIQFKFSDIAWMGEVSVEKVYSSKKSIFQKLKSMFR